MTLPGADTCQPQPAGRTPSGRPAWRHSDACRLYPGKLVDDATAPFHDGPPEAVCEEGRRACRPEVVSVAVIEGPRTYPLRAQLRHAASCPAHPGERIDVREYAKGRTFSYYGYYGWRRRRW